MGFQDRPYASSRGMPGGSRPLNFRIWSVTTWIIVLCTAAFVLDVFLPQRWTEMGTELRSDLPQLDLSQVRETEREVVSSDRYGNPRMAESALVVQTDRGNVVVGRREYQRMPFLESFLHYSTQKGFLHVELWRLVGFQFLHTHGTLAHLLFNMMGLYFFGPVVERHLGSKRYLAFYLLCGIFGALLYTFLNLLGVLGEHFFPNSPPLPGLLFYDLSTPLIGASAGIYGVVIAAAFLVPNAVVQLFFIIPMRLRTLAYLLVGLAFFTLVTGGDNAGGQAGHLGGAIAGFFFIRRPHLLHDFFDVLGRIDPTSKHFRSGRSAARAVAKLQGHDHPSDAEIDRILDKVHNEGLGSLTAKEKAILQRASRR